MSQIAPVTILYATRFGSTKKLASALAEGLQNRGIHAATQNLGDDQSLPSRGRLIILSGIIWDRPLPAMRRWLDQHAAVVADRIVAVGVVCGSAGVRENGGMVYARNLAKRSRAEEAERFAFSGEIPPKSDLKLWEWMALKAFAKAMRKPELFEIQAEPPAALAYGQQLAERLADT